MAVNLRYYSTVSSTQDLVHELAAGGADHGTTVVATAQSGGRGSRGREWSSPAGGLWLSVLCRPGEAPALELLSLRVALEVASALERALPVPRLGLKWPNDLILQDRKLGGILCEARWQGTVPGWVTVGVGINVANPIPAELAERAIALAEFLPGSLPESLAHPVASAVAEAGTRRGPLTADELADFHTRDWLFGRRLRQPIPGQAQGLGPDGSLQIRQADGRSVAVRSGTVEVE